MVQPADKRIVTDARLPELVQDLVALEFGGTQGTGVSVVYDDGAGKLTVSVAAPAAGTDTEAVQDILGAMIVQLGGTYNDAAGTITLPTGSTFDAEQARDAIAAALGGSGYVSVFANDAADTITVGTTTALQTLIDGKVGTTALPGLVETQLASAGTPWTIRAASGGTGAYPARPATTRPVYWMGAVEPTFDGSTSGGGGMVRGLDSWLDWTAQ